MTQNTIKRLQLKQELVRVLFIMDCVSKYENKSAIEKFEIVLHDVTFVAENNKLLWINKYMLSMCYLTN